MLLDRKSTDRIKERFPQDTGRPDSFDATAVFIRYDSEQQFQLRNQCVPFFPASAHVAKAVNAVTCISPAPNDLVCWLVPMPPGNVSQSI